MFNCFNDETPVEWVLGQFDPRDGKTLFGITMEGQGLAHFRYRNEVHAFLSTGFDNGTGAQIRLTGTEGLIEISPSPDVALRYLTASNRGWTSIEVDEPDKGVELTMFGIADLIESLRKGKDAELSGQRALRATELIFATYESGRRGSRVDLPFEGSDRSISQYVEERLAPTAPTS
jgi:predicted dehydrogenase